MRVSTDCLRVDRRYLGLTGSQLMSIAAVSACAVLLVRFRGAPPRWAAPRGPEGPPSDAESDDLTEEAQDAPLGDDVP
jgi:hypothetical protein